MKSKREIRLEFKERRSALSRKQIQEKSIEIANQCLKLDIWNLQNYHLFLSIEKQHEIQTEYLLQVLQGRDKNLIVSKGNFKDYSLNHYLLTDQTSLKLNKYGIPEPSGEGNIQIQESQIDVVFTPLLAADLKGNRVGYGKGFYDRFLEKCRPETIKIGLNFFEPLPDLIEANENDQRLDYLVTPEKIFNF
ncbi:5-formyltetrahydrofolate cyclo-ligase [Nonlabens spongiae]|uniref:5-formyltetrahydrofolate cyclo-ligase n=1 Tax=Nonlabens spongiae TaxID=331648 RepID=A0A1W6MKD4_9FLAO|nr:5-formyltetrahydrofolate cyclo-ligase [Nonlabens spongiae]ARN78055.1 5-formyltetrahydrofolate cyclo-ligase [Nonlabens spongiae]